MHRLMVILAGYGIVVSVLVMFWPESVHPSPQGMALVVAGLWWMTEGRSS